MEYLLNLLWKGVTCDGETFRGQRWCEGARPRKSVRVPRGKTLSREINRSLTPRRGGGESPVSAPSCEEDGLPSSPSFSLAFLLFPRSQLPSPEQERGCGGEGRAVRCRGMNAVRKSKGGGGGLGGGVSNQSALNWADWWLLGVPDPGETMLQLVRGVSSRVFAVV